MKLLKRLAALFCFLLLLAPAYAVVSQDKMKIFAVTTANTAVTAELIVNISPGTGEVWSNVTPLVGTTTQSSERTAVELAKSYVSGGNEYDYLFNINSTASLVDGPSAGAAMSLIVISMLQDKDLPSTVSLTGTVSPEGRIGPVGGVLEKSEKAAEEGIKLFMFPKGEGTQKIVENGSVKTVNLSTYALEEWGMKAVEVESIDEALKLAFSDVEEIDVNAEVIEEKEFYPEPIPFPERLSLMHFLTGKMISETEQKIFSAKSSLSSSFIEDEQVISILLLTLANAEDLLKEAKISFDGNFLYSAANSAFLAKVLASQAKDIADNPSMLQKDSEVFESKLSELKEEIRELKENLNEFIPLDFLEWHIAAKQRVSYAEANLAKISQRKTTIIVDIGGTVVDSTDTLKDVQDYEFAVAWVEAAENFYARTRESEKKALPDDHFKELASEMLIRAEDALTVAPEADLEDLERRLAAAKTENARGWFVASAFDSAAVEALSVASTEVNEKSLDELQEMLSEEITETEAAVNQMGENLVWAQLYLDHSKYFFRASEFYEGEGFNAKAKERARTGVSLVFLAKNLVEVSGKAYEYYGSFSPEDYVSSPFASRPASADAGGLRENLLMVLLGGLAAFGAMLLVVFLKPGVFGAGFSFRGQLNELEKLKKRADNAFADGKISAEKHCGLLRKLELHRELLEHDIRDKSSGMVKIAKTRADIDSSRKSLRELKRLYHGGSLLRPDYEKGLKELKRKAEMLQSSLESEEKMLESEKRDAIQKTARLGEEERLAFSKKAEEKTIKKKAFPKNWAQKEKIFPVKKKSASKTRNRGKTVKGTNASPKTVKGTESKGKAKGTRLWP